MTCAVVGKREKENQNKTSQPRTGKAVGTMRMLVFVLIELALSANTLDICITRKKTFETQGLVPTAMFPADNGIVYETRLVGAD